MGKRYQYPDLIFFTYERQHRDAPRCGPFLSAEDAEAMARANKWEWIAIYREGIIRRWYQADGEKPPIGWDLVEKYGTARNGEWKVPAFGPPPAEQFKPITDYILDTLRAKLSAAHDRGTIPMSDEEAKFFAEYEQQLKNEKEKNQGEGR